jgi:hypothetical protein
MNNPVQPKPNPVPGILVYGTPSGPALTQASWFRAEDQEAVKAAAKELKFAVVELHTDADRALAAGVHEGVLKDSGRMIVGSVSAEVCQIALNRLPVFALKASPPLVTGSDAPEPPRRSWVGLRSRGGSGFRRALRVDALKPGS